MKTLLLSILLLFISCNSAPQEPQITWLKYTKPPSLSGEHKLDFYRNEKHIAKRYYKDGKTIDTDGDIPDGIVIEHEQNKIINIITYRNNMRNGPIIGFYPSGKLKTEGTYKDDNPVGISKRYYQKGSLMAEWEIVDGKELYHREYGEDGKLIE